MAFIPLTLHISMFRAMSLDVRKKPEMNQIRQACNSQEIHSLQEKKVNIIMNNVSNGRKKMS